MCLLLDTPFGRRSVGGIIFVTSGEIAGQRYLDEGGSNSIDGKPYMLALLLTTKRLHNITFFLELISTLHT